MTLTLIFNIYGDLQGICSHFFLKSLYLINPAQSQSLIRQTCLYSLSVKENQGLTQQNGAFIYIYFPCFNYLTKGMLGNLPGRETTLNFKNVPEWGGKIGKILGNEPFLQLFNLAVQISLVIFHSLIKVGIYTLCV